MNRVPRTGLRQKEGAKGERARREVRAMCLTVGADHLREGVANDDETLTCAPASTRSALVRPSVPV
ncbi:hypothetical protein GCM10018782_52030 [Streptomyces griseoaurantiacus]|nr:hypothetical protein GCM10018782_52030 [Streptomyces griseoaurantiacus]